VSAFLQLLFLKCLVPNNGDVVKEAHHQDWETSVSVVGSVLKNVMYEYHSKNDQ
jgi:hypothetical protein